MSNRALQVAAFVMAAVVSTAVGATSAVPANTEPRSVVVHYQPADLESNEGAERLYRTLDRVAHYACGDAGYTLEIVVREELEHCEHAALANAVSSASSANLTAAYNRHFPNQPLLEKERLSQRLQSLIILVIG